MTYQILLFLKHFKREIVIKKLKVRRVVILNPLNWTFTDSNSGGKKQRRLRGGRMPRGKINQNSICGAIINHIEEVLVFVTGLTVLTMGGPVELSYSTLSPLKVQNHEIFYLYFVHESNPSGPLIKKQAKMIFLKNSFSRRYSNLKFKKFNAAQANTSQSRHFLII